MPDEPKPRTAGEDAADLEQARKRLLAGVRHRLRPVAEAKISQLRRQRDEAVHKAHASISSAHAAKGSYNSGGRLAACWSVAVTEADKAIDAQIGELLALGAKEDAMVAYLEADVRLFLSSRMSGQVLSQQAGNPGHAQRLVSSYAANAQMHSARIRDLVTSRSHDFVQAQGTRLERRLKWLAHRPIVTIGGFVWVAITSIYGHLEMFRKVLALLRK